MKIYVPEYFNNFKCSADKCKDSCCIGWEIWIDDKTRAKYDMLNTSLGKEIREKTSHGYFHLCENGHCSFLDGNGLCRIISTLGDGYLCDICREHPRYYGVGQKRAVLDRYRNDSDKRYGMLHWVVDLACGVDNCRNIGF